ncbi:MAG TPA: hypothetical protein VMK13_18785, partial [Streptosporangiaceae bacterium]|nr:hypothetical protein [Streptosporangiaceae bacterium]
RRVSPDGALTAAAWSAGRTVAAGIILRLRSSRLAGLVAAGEQRGVAAARLQRRDQARRSIAAG